MAIAISFQACCPDGYPITIIEESSSGFAGLSFPHLRQLQVGMPAFAAKIAVFCAIS
jgi:hypothetical protein